VNENDTVAIHELRIGDNDTMASQVRLHHPPVALLRHSYDNVRRWHNYARLTRLPRLADQVASLIGADYCFLLTDVNGLYTANPNVRISRVPLMRATT
jgi:glutamate 5-kinase